MSMKCIRALVVSLVLLSGRAEGADDDKQRAQETGCPGKNPILVTGGGGIRGAYQVGALWYLVNVRGCNFGHYVGTSTGAVTAAMLAQSRTQNELRTNVGQLVKNYREFESQGDVVKERFLGKLRMILPTWLGGTDGIYTLDPVISKLVQQVDFSKIPRGKITIPVISLQAGKLISQETVSLLDRVVGSSSIPLAVEPRLARVWVEGELLAIDRNQLMIRSRFPPGAPDDACRLRLGNKGEFRCEYIKTHSVSMTDPAEKHEIDITLVDWRTYLKVDDLPKSVATELASLLSNTARPGTDHPESENFPQITVEFTGVHQLVDGGVTDHLPIQDALDIWAYKNKEGRSEYDSIFVLTTGASSNANVNKELHGGTAIGAAVLDRMWDAYQEKAYGFDINGPIFQSNLQDAVRWIESARAWKAEVEAMLSAEQRARLSQRAAFPDGEYRVIRALNKFGPDDKRAKFPSMFIINPRQRIFQETFEVNKDKIDKALHYGCLLAANFFSGLPEPDGTVYVSDRVRVAESSPECDGLKPRKS